MHFFCILTEEVYFSDSYGDFTVKPADILKVQIGREATFNWQYNPPGSTTVVLEKWCKIDPVKNQCTSNILMTKRLQSPIPVVKRSNTEYASRTIGEAPLTMKIRDIRLTDDGFFEFSAIFDDGTTYYDRVRLMVLGMYYQFHSDLSLVPKFQCPVHKLYPTNNHSSQEHVTYGMSCLLAS